MVIRILLVALLLSGCAKTTQSGLADESLEDSVEGVHPHFKAMKAFRTYVSITRHRPLRHNFWIWYRSDGFGTKSEIAADTVEEAATTDRLPGGFQAGSYEYPDDPPGGEVPAELQTVADALIERLRELNAGREVSEFRARYLGRFANISVVEQVPQGVWSEGTRLFQTHGSYSFRIDENMSSLVPSNSLGVGTRAFCPETYSEECRDEPQLVDFVMPANLEGTVPIGAKLFYGSEAIAAYGPTYAQLEAKIIEAAQAMSEGRYTNPINSVLAAQGDSSLPHASRQEVGIDLAVYFYPEDAGTISERHTFVVKTEELLAGPVVLTKSLAETGFTISLAIDMTAGQVNLSARHSSGAEQSKSLTISTERIMRDGERAYIAGFERIEGVDPDDWESRNIRFEQEGLRALISIDGDVSPARVWSQND